MVAQLELPAPRLNSATNGLSIRLATTPEERWQAGQLVARMYRTEGYLERDQAPDTPFFTRHHQLEHATVFIAACGSEILGTITTIQDSAFGLPMDEIYGSELDTLRAKRQNLCELCSLAVHHKHPKATSKLVLGLFQRVSMFLTQFTETTDALITLNPAHQRFYERGLGFARLGGMVTDPRFADAATIAMRFTREQFERCYEQTQGLTTHQRYVLKAEGQPEGMDKDSLFQEVQLKNITESERLRRQTF